MQGKQADERSSTRGLDQMLPRLPFCAFSAISYQQTCGVAYLRAHLFLTSGQVPPSQHPCLNA